MPLSDILTEEILESYAKACCDMGCDLWTLALEGKHGHLLMPSRGAFPILDHARTSFEHALSKHHGSNSLGYLKEKFSIPQFNQIWLPFTAHSPDGATPSSLQRKHWCSVLKGILDGVDTPALITHRLFTRDICNQRFDYTTTDRNKPEGLVIIDTVISGRAVTEISKSLDEVGIHEFKFLLAVDANGTKMRDPYKTHIKGLERSGKTILYYMENIFTEDSHPGLTGVTAVVFPQITNLLNQHQVIGTTVGFWHLEIARRPNDMNLPLTVTAAVTRVAVYRRICKLLDKADSNYRFEDDSYEKEQLQEQEALGSESPELTRDFILPIVRDGEIAQAVKDIAISSSFIASVFLEENTAQAIAHRCLHSASSSA